MRQGKAFDTLSLLRPFLTSQGTSSRTTLADYVRSVLFARNVSLGLARASLSGGAAPLSPCGLPERSLLSRFTPRAAALRATTELCSALHSHRPRNKFRASAASRANPRGRALLDGRGRWPPNPGRPLGRPQIGDGENPKGFSPANLPRIGSPQFSPGGRESSAWMASARH